MGICFTLVVVFALPQVISTTSHLKKILADEAHNVHKHYRADDSYRLQHLICGNVSLANDAVIELNSSIVHHVHWGNFCILENYYSVVLKGDDPNTQAVVQCEATIAGTLCGFGFYNLTSLTIEYVSFKNFGCHLSTLDPKLSKLIGSRNGPHLPHLSTATLLIIQSKVVFKSVQITSYQGFAVIGANLIQESTFTTLTVSDSVNSFHIGSGILIYFSDNEKMPAELTILNSKFENNSITSFSCEPNDRIDFNFIQFAAGLTIIFAQQNYSANVTISESRFALNFGVFVGALSIMYINSHLSSSTVITDSSFQENAVYCCCNGTALSLYFFQNKCNDNSFTTSPLKIIDTNFQKHTGVHHNPNSTSHVIWMGVNCRCMEIVFTFAQVNFTENAILSTGSCMKVNSHQFGCSVNIHLIDVKAESNFLSRQIITTDGMLFEGFCSLFAFIGIKQVIVSGSKQGGSLFHNNSATVLATTFSDTFLEGNIVFSSNTATTGTAIKMDGLSYLHLAKSSNILFRDNFAYTLGGAIYIHNRIVTSPIKCVFQIQQNSTIRYTINVTFINNTAIYAGSSIFAYPIYDCYMNGSRMSSSKASNYYKEVFKFHDNTVLRSLSTMPKELTPKSHNMITTYPGKQFSVCIAAKDATGHFVYSVIGVSIELRNQIFINKGNEHILKENSKCTPIHITLGTHKNLNVNGSLVFSASNQVKTFPLQIHLQKCLLGFRLNELSNSCDCELAWHQIRQSENVQCNISDGTIKQLTPYFNIWAGTVLLPDGNKVFGVSNNCPFGHCFYIHDAQFFIAISSTTMGLLDNNGIRKPSICGDHRIGVLCGACEKGYSTVISGRNCQKCSNKWLWLIIVYAIVGPLLIYLLYVLRLTLTTGTLNGFIFYAHAVVNIGPNELLFSFRSNGILELLSDILKVFIQPFQLQLPLPTCFFNGMTELWRRGLVLLFPLYLLTIVVALIILSHFSIRVSNRIAHFSVQVLVTVVHLSFSSFLVLLVDTFTPGYIHTSNSVVVVWYWDGNVAYGSNHHVVLMVISSFVGLSLLFPYILLLLFSKPVRRYRCIYMYTKNILDSIHAPYKESKQYWFVLRLLFFTASYIVYTLVSDILTSISVISISLGLVTIAQAYYKPFKNKFIDYLDLLIMINLFILATTTGACLVARKYTIIAAITVCCILVVMLTFFAVIVGHVLWVTGKYKMFNRQFQQLRYRVSTVKLSSNDQFSSHQALERCNDSFYGSCSQFREPLIDS